MNLRADSTFVEDASRHEAAKRYQEFLRAHQTGRVLYWEFGVGANTPGIIKYPFWALTKENPAAVYCAMNQGEAVAPQEIAAQIILVDGDIDASLKALQEAMERIWRVSLPAAGSRRDSRCDLPRMASCE